MSQRLSRCNERRRVRVTLKPTTSHPRTIFTRRSHTLLAGSEWPSLFSFVPFAEYSKNSEGLQQACLYTYFSVHCGNVVPSPLTESVHERTQ